jgi:DNA helicase-2/ATP-dependent DNA helicase PcrA
LNRHSCKGLEFDFVFIPELQSINIDGSSLDTFKMNMYVMCSRAREALFMLYSSSTGEDVEVVQYLPSKDSNLLEYKNV